MTVVSIFAVLLAISVPTYSMIVNNISLRNESYEIMAALRSAQNRAIASQGNLTHGVHFDTDKYVVFAGSWPSTDKIEYKLNPGLSISTGAGSEIIFKRLTGEASSAVIQNIEIGSSPTATSTIAVDPTGKITIE